MDYAKFLLWLTSASGIFFMILSFFMKKDEKMRSDDDYEKVTEKADEVIQDLNSQTETIFNEMESKYRELLYLYQMIDEKKKEAFSLSLPNEKMMDQEMFFNLSEKPKEPIKSINQKNFKDHVKPRIQAVENLLNSGYSIKDISRKLHMGQDEINFIMEIIKME